jgi:5-methylcytosine-specific restriction endonuclease McrA
MKSELKQRTLQNLANVYSRYELRINEEYQRGAYKWSRAQKQGLIDSLLRGYQIPLFYVHLLQKLNKFTDSVETTADLVDGQQRLATIVSYLHNEFSLPNPQNAALGTALPVRTPELPRWSGKKFEELDPEDKACLLGRELLVVQMTEDAPNEARDLFIRLQAGTPLTAQEKRDAWPGEFTNFVIRHAGKPGHRLSKPKAFFNLFPRSRRLSVDDDEHYVDGLAETRKFFAGLAMTIMVRERSDVDFVDLKGKVINDFYTQKENLELTEGDPGALRVVRVLDLVAQLPGFETLREGRPSFQWAFHLALLVDSLDEGNYAAVWHEDVVSAFIAFRQDVANAQLHYRQNHESLPFHERFGRLLSGSGSDTADVIRVRHSFLLAEVYPKIRIIPRDQNRRFDALEREVIWNRDRGLCQNPDCKRPGRRVSFGEATIHHVIEHTAGGETTLQNGILICPDCHPDRTKMQSLTSRFQEYLQQIYANLGKAEIDARPDEDTVQAALGNEPDENGARPPRGRLKIVIDWGALDVDREMQTIMEDKDSDSIIKLLVELIGAFGDSMKNQLTDLPVIRYPLSKTPATDFLNRARGTPYDSLPVPGTELYFCPQSHRTEKVERLRIMFSRLTLPDGRDFPPASVEVSIDAP